MADSTPAGQGMAGALPGTSLEDGITERTTARGGEMPSRLATTNPKTVKTARITATAARTTLQCR